MIERAKPRQSRQPQPRQPRRLPLPISSGFNILPGSWVEFTARPQTSKFYPERLLIKEAASWRVDALSVEGRSGALVRDMPGATFSSAAPGRFPGCGEIEIPCGDRLVLRASYVGPLESGIPFEACVFGSDMTPSPIARVSHHEERLATVRSEHVVPPHTTIKLSTDPTGRDAWPCRVVIEDAHDWVVNDVLVGDASIFVQSGDVPGSMFSGDVQSAICLGHLPAGVAFSVVATYVGDAPGRFSYGLYGTLDESMANDLPIAAILPMSSGVNVLPNTSAQITSRCHSVQWRPTSGAPRHRGIGPRHGFLAERVVVEGAADWAINDIKIGIVSQFAQSVDVPGVAFGPDVLGGAVSFDVARAWVDVVIVVTHVGPREAGGAFVCGMLGSIVDMTDVDPGSRYGRVLSVRDADTFGG